MDCGFVGYSTSHATRLPGVQDGLGAKEAKSLKRPVCRVGNTWLGRGEMGEGDWCCIVLAEVESGGCQVLSLVVVLYSGTAGSKERRGK